MIRSRRFYDSEDNGNYLSAYEVEYERIHQISKSLHALKATYRVIV